LLNLSLQSFKKLILFLTVVLIISKIALTTTIFLYPRVNPNLNEETAIKPQELIDLTNNYRLSLGLNPLKVNARLTQAAVNKASDLLTNQYFSHTSPSGKKFSQWIKEINYNYFYVGENLAIDFNNSQDLFRAWIDSPSHRDNIVKPQYQEIGLAALKGKFENHSAIVVVQLFGSRVLGDTETDSAADSSDQKPAANYFYPEDFWQKLVRLENLEELNRLNNYLLMVFVGFCLILYAPKKKINQINIKQPIINRYQAKIFRE